ncbi:hypothetical protein [Paraburkholderia fungorum]|uniref:hypothetical protein n=1 Tax=Paraburkholderia fungorum TaxID=134537 RepID=UPI0038BCC528
MLFLSSLAVLSAAEPRAPVDTPLGVPDGFSAIAIDSIGSGRYCVSGFVYDDAGPSESAYVLLLDANSRQVIWRTLVPHDRGSVSSSATRCLSDDHAYYVITQENTNSSESLNQTRVVINKISDNGNLLRQKPIEAGFDEWAFLLDVQPDAISVGGGTSATLNRGGQFGTFVEQFDTNLVRTKTIRLDSGAFWTASNARLNGESLLVAGQFLPNTASLPGRTVFPASKIDLANRKYVWSSYASPPDTQQAHTIFAEEDTTYTVALTATRLSVLMLDHTGKTVSSFSVKKPLCGINALTVDGRTLKVLGSSCEKESSSVIAVVDMIDKTVVVLRKLDANVSASQFDGQSWVGIVTTKTHGQVFRRGAV